MDFPVEPAAPADTADTLARALGVRPAYVGKNRFDYLAELDSEEAVRALEPDLALLRAIDARGFIVTARSSSKDYDFVSRFFAPAVGVDEDPVTGSAHCCLGPHWGARLGRTVLTGYQASRRGGVVRVGLNGDRVLLGGRAVTILKGEVVV
jgi:predicted PhzF superfamily epimerase YddE/YHI9